VSQTSVSRMKIECCRGNLTGWICVAVVRNGASSCHLSAQLIQKFKYGNKSLRMHFSRFFLFCNHKTPSSHLINVLKYLTTSQKIIGHINLSHRCKKTCKQGEKLSTPLKFKLQAWVCSSKSGVPYSAINSGIRSSVNVSNCPFPSSSLPV